MTRIWNTHKQTKTALKGTVFVGLSGGVDSSVAAARLKNAGHRVVGIFIKVWHPSFLECNWEKERLDAMRVCATLGIPFLTCDATERYKAEVADYLISEYKAGRTPNPDVMCNKHIKFGAFLDFADEHGADCIATGHYARRMGFAHSARLLRGVDSQKDQSYFLWTLTQAQLSRTLFPIGDSLKADIRKEAARYGLPTAEKPDSQGVCFLGELDMKEFLFHFIPREAGEVRDETGTVVGEHDGAVFYTVGQRHGFRLHQTDPNEPAYYIVAKNIEENALVVSHEKPMVGADALCAPAPQSDLPFSFSLSGTNWIGNPPNGSAEIQTRYRQKPVLATIKIGSEGRAPNDRQFRQRDMGSGTTGRRNRREWERRSKIGQHRQRDTVVTPLETLDAPAAGQSCVVYDGDTCLGGGIVESFDTLD